MTNLSARLEAIASFVPEGAYLADVGSDHALLPIALLERGRISYAQAIDNKMAPYLRMKRNVEEAGFANHVLCSLSNGLDELSPNATAVAICGVGGHLTCDLLEKGREKLQNVEAIVLDPHRDLIEVRRRVSELGYRIADETMIREAGIFYSIMKWEKGKRPIPYTEDELAFGPILLQRPSETFRDFIEEQLDRVKGLLDSLPAKSTGRYRALYSRLKNIKKRILLQSNNNY